MCRRAILDALKQSPGPPEILGKTAGKREDRKREKAVLDREGNLVRENSGKKQRERGREEQGGKRKIRADGPQGTTAPRLPPAGGREALRAARTRDC